MQFWDYMPSLFGYFQPGNSCKLQILHGSFIFQSNCLYLWPPKFYFNRALVYFDTVRFVQHSSLSFREKLNFGGPYVPQVTPYIDIFLGFFCNIINSCWDFIFQAVGILSSKLLGFCLPNCWDFVFQTVGLPPTEGV